MRTRGLTSPQAVGPQVASAPHTSICIGRGRSQFVAASANTMPWITPTLVGRDLAQSQDVGVMGLAVVLLVNAVHLGTSTG